MSWKQVTTFKSSRRVMTSVVVPQIVLISVMKLQELILLAVYKVKKL
jgi:hypothetical protein